MWVIKKQIRERILALLKWQHFKVVCSLKSHSNNDSLRKKKTKQRPTTTNTAMFNNKKMCWPNKKNEEHCVFVVGQLIFCYQLALHLTGLSKVNQKHTNENQKPTKHTREKKRFQTSFFCSILLVNLYEFILFQFFFERQVSHLIKVS